MLIKNSIIYLFSGVLSKAIPFILLPIMTKYLSTEEYGALSIYLIMISIFNAFIGMNIHANISKNYYKVSRDNLALYIGNILIIIFMTFNVCLILTIVFINFYDNIFSIPSKWVLVIPFISAMMMINEINVTILRNEQKAIMFGVFEVANSLIKMFLTILFLVVFSLGWYSQVLGMIIGGILFSLIGIVYMRRGGYINIIIDKTKLKSILRISLPLIPHVLGGIIISMSDRLFIEKMVGLDEVGIYSVGYMFGIIVMLFTDSFIKAWSPWFYMNMADPVISTKRKIVKYTYLYIIAVFGLAVVISSIGKLILPYFVDQKFIGAENYILWIALGYAVHGVYKIFFPYLVHISKTSFLAFSTIVAAIINLVLNYLFIRSYGAIGAAYATLVSFAVSATLVFWYQSNNYYMPWLLRIDYRE